MVTGEIFFSEKNQRGKVLDVYVVYRVVGITGLVEKRLVAFEG